MTVLDAFAVVALLKGEPAAPEVQRLLDDGGASLTASGVAEVVDHLVRLVGATEDEAALDLAQLALADPEPLDASVCLRAGMTRARHYHRTRRPVSVADCVLAEVARAGASPVATSDPPLLEMCREEGIGVVVLPDSRGRIWSG
jgi:predicted nucleic acid-binding protein